MTGESTFYTSTAMIRQTIPHPDPSPVEGFCIHLTPGEGRSIIRLSGAVAVQDITAFESALLAMPGRIAGSAVLDLRGLSFINVIGLGVIVQLGNALAARGDRLVLHGAQPHVSRLIRTMRLHELFAPEEPEMPDQPTPLREPRRSLSICA